MTDSLDFDHVLSTCLDRLRAGNTLEVCLEGYPSHAARLAPLLRVASLLQAPDGPEMSTEGFRAGEARLLACAARLRARQKGPSPARRRAISGLLAGTRRLVVATVLGVLLLCGVLGAGTVSAASSSLPGSPLYPVKRATETLVSSVALTPKLQTRVHLTWAERRLREAEVLMAQGGVADEAVLAALEQETQQALAAAEQVGLESLTAVVVHTRHQQTVLSQLLDKAPQAARPGLERALAASARGNARAQSALDRSVPGGPAVRPGPPVVPPGQVDDRKSPKIAPSTAPAGDVPGMPTTTPSAVDELHPPEQGQGQGVGPAPGKGAEQGYDQDKGQDEAKDPDCDQGQGQGYGPDKDEPHPSGTDKDQGKELVPGKGQGKALGLGQADGQDRDPDCDPDCDQGNSSRKDKQRDNRGRGQIKNR